MKLGLCNSPEPIYLFIKQQNSNGQTYLWYRFDFDTEQSIPVAQRALAGYLTEIRVTEKSFKNQENTKLDIMVRTEDEVYIIRSGMETSFTKTFLLAASQLINDFNEPLVIATVPGKSNTVFCHLYDSKRNKIFRNWDPHADWAGIIATIQGKLEQKIQVQAPSPKLKSHPQDLRVKQLRTLLDYPLNSIYNWLNTKNVQYPSQLPVQEVDKLVELMCRTWAQENFGISRPTLNIRRDLDEISAISQWMSTIKDTSEISKLSW